MAVFKFLRWREDEPSSLVGEQPEGLKICQIVYMEAYNQRTVDDYINMAEIVCKEFPHLNLNPLNFECARVIKSVFCYGASAVRISVHMERKKYEGWTDVKEGDYLSDYCFQ